MKLIPTFGSPISDLELWQCAKLQLERFGNEAFYEAANRMAEMMARDEFAGYATWSGIAVRIALLAQPVSSTTRKH